MIEQLQTHDTDIDVEPGLDPATPDAATAASTVTFEVESVTGSRTMTATFQTDLETGAAARAIANELGLGSSVPWMLRRASSSAYLDEKVSVGKQLRHGEKVQITPKAHLGA